MGKRKVQLWRFVDEDGDPAPSVPASALHRFLLARDAAGDDLTRDHGAGYRTQLEPAASNEQRGPSNEPRAASSRRVAASREAAMRAREAAKSLSPSAAQPLGMDRAGAAAEGRNDRPGGVFPFGNAREPLAMCGFI
jgi:hypothetical protein